MKNSVARWLMVLIQGTLFLTLAGCMGSNQENSNVTGKGYQSILRLKSVQTDTGSAGPVAICNIPKKLKGEPTAIGGLEVRLESTTISLDCVEDDCRVAVVDNRTTENGTAGKRHEILQGKGIYEKVTYEETNNPYGVTIKAGEFTGNLVATVFEGQSVTQCALQIYKTDVP